MYSDCYEGPLSSDPHRRTSDQESGPRGKFTLDEVTDLGSPGGSELVRPCDIKGILHSHSRWTDGAHSLDSMVKIAREIGLEYLGISDHYVSEAHQEGLDLSAAIIQRAEVDRLTDKYPNFDVLQGIEVDVNPDGTLPVDNETLDHFDFVIAGFAENGDFDKKQLLEQVVRAALHPKVTILGTPVGDFMLRGCNGSAEMERVLEAAAERFGWKEARPGSGVACGYDKGGYTATCAEVSVSGTGEVRVTRIVTAFDCGAVINPTHLRNQIEGAAVMALGPALFESIGFERGAITNASFSGYRIPRFGDMPRIDAVLIDRRDTPSAGAGETPFAGIAPAIGNAIFSATGARLRSLPLAPKGVKV